MDIQSELKRDEILIDLLVKNKFSTLLQQSLFDLNQKNPTKIQAEAFNNSQLIEYFHEQNITQREKSLHIIIQSGYYSGKTQLLLLILLNRFLKMIEKEKEEKPQTQYQNESLIDQNGTVGLVCVYLCSSIDVCKNNQTLASQLLSSAIKYLNLNILNINQVNEKNISLLPKNNYFIIGTPNNYVKFMQYSQIPNQQYISCAFDDIDYMISFKQDQALNQIDFHLKKYLKTMLIIFSTVQDAKEEVVEWQNKLMSREEGKIIHVMNKMNNDVASKEETLKIAQSLLNKEHQLISQFYFIGEDINKYIILYVIFKLNFVGGKTIIVCKNLNIVYKLYLFLDRIGVKSIQIYNEQDPKNLRYYIFSIFNTGVIRILISTKGILDDLQTKLFYSKKRKILQFKQLGNIVLFNTTQLQNQYHELYRNFRNSPGMIISLFEEKEVESLSKIIEKEKKMFQSFNIREIPLSAKEINAFKYRINDIVQSISQKQIKKFQLMDFKKKILKSKDLADYFKKNSAERKLLIEQINKLSRDVHKYEIKYELDIPDYLLPQFAKDERNKIEQQKQSKPMIERILVQSKNEKFEENLAKRQKNQYLDEQIVKKKRKIMEDKYVTINEENENPEITDPSRLQILSNRKLWKKKHGFKLKKINKRLEKKGIFNS